jgi:hypothetical protein
MELSMNDLRELVGGGPNTASKHYLEHFEGKTIALWCMNYIYSGILLGVEDGVAVLSDAKVVYQTGPLDATEWEDAQSLPGKSWCVSISAIESFGEVNK